MTDHDHKPVMLDEVLDLLQPSPGQVILDCTAGRGGHAEALIQRLAPGGRYIGLDVDAENIEYTRQRLSPHTAVRIDLVNANFAQATEVFTDLDIPRVDLLLADLGFASSQMFDPKRGFSFTVDGPLDMRLDPRLGTTAADLLASLSQRELADILYQYGQERFSRQIAQKIVDRRKVRPMKSTEELAAVCASVYARRTGRQRIHPATRTFMALRIAVNDELACLQELLDSVSTIVNSGGRAAIISFHSLEDRLVKQTFRQLVKSGRATHMTTKPLTPSQTEQADNPRSRSAKLRAICLN